MSLSDSELVNITTGIAFSFGSDLTQSRNFFPSIFGILRSSRIRLGVGALPKIPCFDRNWRASTPLFATEIAQAGLPSRNACSVISTSPSLSSTSNTSAAWSCGLLVVRWDREDEVGAFSQFGLKLNVAATKPDEFATSGKSYARSWVFLFSVQSLEDRENSIVELVINANAIVANGELPSIPHGPSTNFDARRLNAVLEFEGVPDQILKQDPHQCRTCCNERQISAGD